MRANNDNNQKEDYSNSKNNDKNREFKDEKNSNSNADNQSIFLTGTNISDKNSNNNNCISLKMKKNIKNLFVMKKKIGKNLINLNY